MNDLAIVVLERLARSSVQSLVLLAVAWAALRLLKAGPAIRARLWWLVSAQMLLGLLLGPVELPWLPAAREVAPLTPSTIIYMTAPAWHAAPIVDTASAIGWPTVVVSIWALVVLGCIALDIVGWRATRSLVSASPAIDDGAVLALAEACARSLGLRRLPRLHSSADIAAPHVTGLWRPVILLPPAGCMAQRDLAMSMAHEMAHVRRGDLWLGLLPVLARRLFFFNPAAWLAMREYALAREAACDRLVIDDAQAAPLHYGRLLLSLGVGRSLQASLGSASPTYKSLKRRLTMLQQPSENPVQRTLAWIVIGMVAVAGTVPYRVTAAPSDALANASSAVPAAEPIPAMDALPAQAAMSAREAMPASAAPALQEPPSPPSPSPMPPESASLPPPPPPPAPPAPPVSAMRASQTSITIRSDQPGLAFALHDRGMQIVDGDIDFAGQSGDEPTIWVRDGSHRYVIRDKTTIDRVQDAFKSQYALSERQRAIGEKQAALGQRQALLGREQAELGMRQAKAAMADSQVNSQVREANSAARHAEIARLQHDIAERQRPIGEQQRQLGEQQAALGEQQRAMSASVREQTQRTIREAIRSGIAKPVTAN